MRSRPHALALATLASLLVLNVVAPCASRAAKPATPSAPADPAAAIASLRWRSLGPFRAGWATSVCGVAGEPNVFYFGGSGGGVWKTDDAGLTWTPLMQHESASAVGALAVAPSDPRVLYVGTGQEGSRYDLMPGDGVFRSSDGGATWTHAGLGATRHVGAVLVDPRDANRVLVAALGHAFARNPERGVFLTTDGGRTWRGVLQPGDSVGAVDLASDPTAPTIVFAATWQRQLHPWFDYFQSQSGAGSGVWKSVDGGEHWTRLANGLPTGALGRIGLAVARGTGGRVVYAGIAADGARRGAAGAGLGGLYRSDDAGEHWALVNPDGSLGNNYFGRLVVAPDDSNTVYVTGQSLRRSRDGGHRFEVVRGSPGGDDYHALWIDPARPASMIAGSDQGAAVSVNGGATWSSWYNQPTGQFYRLAADERFPYHVYSGQQDNGTVEIASRGPYGAIEERDWHPVGGDERDPMIPKPGDPAIVFGGGLGGGVSRFDEATRQSAEVSPWAFGGYGARPTSVKYRFGWITPIAISPAAPHALYLGAQVVFRSLDDGAHWDVVSPDLTARRDGAAGCDDAEPTDATARDCGFGVIACLAPSPLAAGVLWVGTDDGLVQLTRDGGATWRDVTPPAVPAWGSVVAIDPSPLDTASAYAAIDLHRLDRHAPLLVRTHDAGRTWTTITAGLPADEFTSVVRCDRVQRGLLYAGTNRSVYVSFDDGERWQPLAPNLPTTWIRDLLPHHDDLLLATQGRGLWALDDLAPLREAAEAVREPLHLVAPPPAYRLRTSQSHDTPWPPETPLGENPPTGAIVDYWLARAPRGAVTLEVRDPAGALVRRFASSDPPESLGSTPYFERGWLGSAPALSAAPGMHRFVWDLHEARPLAPAYGYSIAAVRASGTPLRPEGPMVPPGRYTLVLAADGVTRTRTLEVRRDPRSRASDADLAAQHALAREACDALTRTTGAQRAIEARLARTNPPLAPALADSLRALSGREQPNLASVTRTLAGLVSAIQTADTAPPQGLEEALRATLGDARRLLARWNALPAAAR